MNPFQNIWGNPKIHPSVRIGAYVEIGDDVEIDENTVIGAGAFLCPGVRIGKKVFIAPRVCFTNDKHPYANNAAYLKEITVVEDEVSIGANSTILPGVRLGFGCVIGAGSVVTKDVPARTVVYGNPAKTREMHHSEDAL